MRFALALRVPLCSFALALTLSFAAGVGTSGPLRAGGTPTAPPTAVTTITVACTITAFSINVSAPITGVSAGGHGSEADLNAYSSGLTGSKRTFKKKEASTGHPLIPPPPDMTQICALSTEFSLHAKVTVGDKKVPIASSTFSFNTTGPLPPAPPNQGSVGSPGGLAFCSLPGLQCAYTWMLAQPPNLYFPTGTLEDIDPPIHPMKAAAVGTFNTTAPTLKSPIVPHLGH